MLRGRSFSLSVIIIVSLFVEANGQNTQSLQDPFKQDWLMKRAEEVAIVKAVRLLQDAVGKFGSRVEQYEKPKHLTRNANVYGDSGKLLRLSDQVQHIIYNAIRNKTRCQSCHLPLNS